MEALMAYLHYLAMLLIAGFLVGELVLCRPRMSATEVRLLARLDIAFFAAALLAAATGLGRLFFWAKGAAFYLPNPIFWLKMALYVVIAALSVRPTIQFIRWNRGARNGTLPSDAQIAAVRRSIHIELALLALIPLVAVLMARGVGR
jgi:putative membrane protein